MLKTFVFMIAVMLCVSVANAASNNQVLTGNELKEATAMNEMYARHMFSSTCVEKQKSLNIMGILTADEQSQRVTAFKKSCDCVTDAILKQFPPNDLIAYVGALDGTFPPGVSVRPKPDPVVVKKYAQIAAIEREIKTRHQCGFNK